MPVADSIAVSFSSAMPLSCCVPECDFPIVSPDWKKAQMMAMKIYAQSMPANWRSFGEMCNWAIRDDSPLGGLRFLGPRCLSCLLLANCSWGFISFGCLGGGWLLFRGSAQHTFMNVKWEDGVLTWQAIFLYFSVTLALYLCFYSVVPTDTLTLYLYEKGPVSHIGRDGISMKRLFRNVGWIQKAE